MPNVRLVPANGRAVSMTANGRSYSCAVGATIDVPDFDAQVLQANGFVRIADTVGPTSQRPSKPLTGQAHHDTTLNKNVIWEGAAWRDPATGGVV